MRTSKILCISFILAIGIYIAKGNNDKLSENTAEATSRHIIGDTTVPGENVPDLTPLPDSTPIPPETIDTTFLQKDNPRPEREEDSMPMHHERKMMMQEKHYMGDTMPRHHKNKMRKKDTEKTIPKR